jgi:hypothetical protein
VLIVLGTLPFVAYLYSPLGAGDRFLVVSSIGGALVLAGLIHELWNVWAPVAVGAVAVVLVAGVAARGDRTLLWGVAGDDALAILEAAQARWPEPPERIVLGPTPIQVENVVAFADNSNVAAALRLRYDDPGVQAFIAQTVDDFESVPTDERLDIRPISGLDDEAMGFESGARVDGRRRTR